MDEKVKEWINDINALAKIAKSEPQLVHAAYVYGTSKKWAFVCRTTPNVSEHMKKLEHHIKEVLLPAIVGREFISDESRQIFGLPAKYGGLSILNPTFMANIEYECSSLATKQLTKAIYNQNSILNIDDEALSDTIKEIKAKKDNLFKSHLDQIKNECNTAMKRIIELASEKGSSSWLTSLPLKQYGFRLNKQEFHDAICLRYDMKIKDTARTCVCGETYSVNHCLTCKKGGYVILRHNSLRDLTAEVLREVCVDVGTEPPLQPVHDEPLPPGSNKSDGARLDVSARSVWSPLSRAFFDIRVFNPLAQSNKAKTIASMYSSHEQQKKREYNQRVIMVEHGSFSPLVFSTSGGMGPEAQRLLKQIAWKMSYKRNEQYSHVISFLRRRFRFDVLRTCVIALRGYKAGTRPDNVKDLDLNLRKIAY